MKKNCRGFLFSLVVCTVFSAVQIGCSSAPYLRAYKDFSDPSRAAHNYVRGVQDEAHQGKFAGVVASLAQIEKKLAGQSCYKIVSATYQLGIYEPEMIFIGESANSSQKAYLFVPPVLDDLRTYQGPDQEGRYSVFRLDQEVPHAAALLKTLTSIVGDDQRCVKLAVAPTSEQTEFTVIAATIERANTEKSLPKERKKK